MIKVTFGSQNLNSLKHSTYVNKKTNTSNVDPRKEKIKEELKSIIDDAASIIRKYRDQEKLDNEKRMNEVMESVEELLGRKPQKQTEKTVVLDNTEFTTEELSNATNVLKSAESSIDDSISKSKVLDYVNYGHFEIARNIVDKYSKKNLNPQQGELINKVLNDFIDKTQTMHENIIKNSYTKTDFEFYGLKKSEAQIDDLASVTEGKVVATNLELIKKVTTIFSSVDFSDSQSVTKAISEYRTLVGKAYEELTEYNSKIQERLDQDQNSIENTISNILAAANGVTHVSDEA